jgi:hypothetical protein
MPDVIAQLRQLGGPALAPSPEAHRAGLQRLQREIDRELRPPRARRLGVLVPAAAVAALGIAVAVALVPSNGPGAQQVLERAAAAVSADQPEILTADIQSRYGARSIWVRQVPGRGTVEVRWLDADGDETVSHPTADPAPGEWPFTTEEYSAADHRLSVQRGTQASASPEIFSARELLRRARSGAGEIELSQTTVNGRSAYELRWKADTSRTRNPVTIEQTLWVDRDTYAPLRYSEHSFGTDAAGKPLDETDTTVITGFRRLPDTPANRGLLAMSPHPDGH